MTGDGPRYTIPPPTYHLEAGPDCPTCGGTGDREREAGPQITCGTCHGEGTVGGTARA